MPTPDPFAAVAALGITAPRAAARLGGLLPVLLPQAISNWRESSTGWIQVDDPESAAILLARRPPTEPPRLVVLGETNRGKSSLVNSLIGVPGLSPVDAGTATCTYLVFTFAPNPYTVARFGGGMADVSFPIGDLRAWSTVDGEPDIDIPTPRLIEVGVPADLLRQLTVVDTPGVGGLVASHAELAAEAAAAATALLFVVDASAPFTRGELDFLAAVGDRVDDVHFAVTKTDAYRGWREIVDADRRLLSRYAPRFAEAHFYPVSSRLAHAAAAQPDPAIAAMVLETSGLTALRTAMVAEVVGAATILADANTMRTSITVITGSLERLEHSRLALTAGAAQAERLRTRREELVGQRRTGGRNWQINLRAEIQRARIDLSHDTAREVREASAMFRASIDRSDSAELKTLPFHIDAYAQTMTARAHTRLIEAMGRICRTVLAELFTTSELTMLVSHLATRPYGGLTTRSPEKARNMDESIMTLSGAGMGFTLSRMVVSLPFAALPAAFGIALAPISIVVGGAAALYLVRSRRRMAEKQHLKQWLMEVLGEVKAQIDQNIAEQFIEADAQLTLALDDVLNRQVASLDAEIREVDGALKLDASERAATLRGITGRRSTGLALVASGEELLGRLRTTRVSALSSADITGVIPDAHLGSAPHAVTGAVPGPDADRTQAADVTGVIEGADQSENADTTDAIGETVARHTADTDPADRISAPPRSVDVTGLSQLLRDARTPSAPEPVPETKPSYRPPIPKGAPIMAGETAGEPVQLDDGVAPIMAGETAGEPVQFDDGVAATAGPRTPTAVPEVEGPLPAKS